MPKFILSVTVEADTLQEAEKRLALVQAAVWAVEDARKGGPQEDIQEGLEALDRRLGGPYTVPFSEQRDGFGGIV